MVFIKQKKTAKLLINIDSVNKVSNPEILRTQLQYIRYCFITVINLGIH